MSTDQIAPALFGGVFATPEPIRAAPFDAGVAASPEIGTGLADPQEWNRLRAAYRDREAK